MEQALAGYRIIDFGQYIAGPYAAMLLSEQGADVIKVERPEGDPFRSEPGFIVWNRSKKGITLDLKKEEGKRIARELARSADVVIENFRPGVASRLGIGYEALSEENPALIYCSISGFGQKGPYRDIPGWDPIVASKVGVYVDQSGEGNPPLYLVLPLPSLYSALMAAFSIAVALYERELTGKGQMIDISLMNSLMYSGSVGLIEFEGNIRIPFTDPQGSIPLYKFYQGKDGEWFFLGLGNLTFFTKFAILMGHEEWLVDPLFEGAPFLIMPPRNQKVISMLKEIFLTRTRDEWIELLRSHDIPCAPAQPVEKFLEDPQVIANDMVVEVEQPGIGKVKEMGIPVKLSLNPGRIKGPSPSLGQHTEEVLSQVLGYSKGEIEKLKTRGII